MSSKLNDKKMLVKEFFVDCPMGKRLDSCPGKITKKLPFPEILKIVGNMSEEKLDALISHHEKCFKSRSMVKEFPIYDNSLRHI